MRRMRGQEPIARRGCAQQHHVDVRIARDPRITEQLRADLIERERSLPAQPVERVAQGPPPLLVPAGLAAAVAAAVAAPALDAMDTAPRRVLRELDLPRRRDLRAVLGVVRQPRPVPALLDPVSYTHLTLPPNREV